jgi:tetratricopeptide (TPR) repeat protein
VQKLVLAEILVSRGNGKEAMRLIHEAEETFSTGSDPDPAAIRGLHLLRGRILATAGEGPAAEAEFLREIALFPDQTGAYSHLAILYAIAAGPLEAEATLDRMVARNPDPAAYATAIRTARVLHMEAAAGRYAEAARRRFPGDPRIEPSTQSRQGENR